MTARRELPHDPDRIKERLRRDVKGVLAALGFDTKSLNLGQAFMPLNPMRRDRKPGSFVIWTDGDRALAWKDFATGEDGNPYGLIMGVLRLARWIDAYWWALNHLNLGRHDVRTASQAEADKRQQERDQKAAEAKRQADEDGKSAELFKRWLDCKPLAGTVAETYLREARKIDLSLLPRLPAAIRFAPALDHFDQETGEVTTWPAMFTAMTRGKAVVSIHRTWLMPDGSGKAPVNPPKKMVGPSRHAAIRLSNGVKDITPTKAVERNYFTPLIIGEGIETTLSAAIHQPDYRAWAAGSLSLMGLLEWPECASAIILLGENDGGQEARTAFDRACKHFEAQAKGRRFKAVFPRVGKDFNDWERAA